MHYLHIVVVVVIVLRVSSPGQTQAGLGPRVYPSTTQTAALPESNAGSGVIKPASSFVIQNRQTSCSMWCPMYSIGYAVSTWSAVCSEAPPFSY